MDLGPHSLGQRDRAALVSQLDRPPLGVPPFAPPSGALLASG
jgi:hypothetical protein